MLRSWRATLHNLLLDVETPLEIEVLLLREYDKLPEDRLTCRQLATEVIYLIDHKFKVEKR